MKCAACGDQVLVSADRCPGCGTALFPQPTPRPYDQSHVGDQVANHTRSAPRKATTEEKADALAGMGSAAMKAGCAMFILVPIAVIVLMVIVAVVMAALGD